MQIAFAGMPSKRQCHTARLRAVASLGRVLGCPPCRQIGAAASCTLRRDGRGRARGVSLSYQHRGLLCDIVGLAAGSAGSAGTFLIVEERDYIGHELG